LKQSSRKSARSGLCNSAGFGTSGPFHRLPVQHEREEITVNALALRNSPMRPYQRWSTVVRAPCRPVHAKKCATSSGATLQRPAQV